MITPQVHADDSEMAAPWDVAAWPVQPVVDTRALQAGGSRGFLTPLDVLLPPSIRSRVFLSPLQGLARPPSGIAMQRFR